METIDYDSYEPTSIDDALSTPNAHKWKPAIQSEIDSMIKHKVLELVTLPIGAKCVGSRFVFKIKDADSQNPRYKARFVAQGFSQTYGEDYLDTFAPVVKYTTVRTLISFAAAHRLKIMQFDIETAFLNSDLDFQNIYLRQPEHFIKPGQEHLVYQVNRALYGLKQSPYLWNKDLKEKLVKIGFTQATETDESIFLAKDIILILYVDDITMMAKNQHLIDKTAAALRKFFTIHDLGPVKRFLGLDITQHPDGSITISQETYARRILERFNMQNCNPAKSPFIDTTPLHLHTEDEEPGDQKLYQQITGSFMHLSVWTRPDLTFRVTTLSQYSHNPSILHERAAKHLLRYLKGTYNFSITYYPIGHPENTSSTIGDITGFVDASHASDPDDRKSITGHIYFLNGGPIVWNSGKQRIIALSSMEGEYLTLSEAAKEAAFLQKLRSTFYEIYDNTFIPYPIPLYTDSTSALDHVKNNIKHARTKHIDIRHHYIRQAVDEKIISLHHIPAAQQAADILTKALPITKHEHALQLLPLTY